MKRFFLGTGIILAAMLVASSFAHTTHNHGPAEETGTNAVGAKCVLCSAGPVFDVIENECAVGIGLRPTSIFFNPPDETTPSSLVIASVDSRAPPTSQHT